MIIKLTFMFLFRKDIASGGNDDWAMSTRAEGGPGIPLRLHSRVER